MPLFSVIFTKEVEVIVEAVSLEQLEEAAEHLANSGYELDHDWNAKWDSDVSMLPARLQESKPDCGLWKETILAYSDYLSAKKEHEESEGITTATPEPRDTRTLPLFHTPVYLVLDKTSRRKSMPEEIRCTAYQLKDREMSASVIYASETEALSRMRTLLAEDGSRVVVSAPDDVPGGLKDDHVVAKE